MLEIKEEEKEEDLTAMIMTAANKELKNMNKAKK